MAHSRISFGIWIFISVVYLLFTAWAIYYALTCAEFLCAMVMVLPGLPWYALLGGLMDQMSERNFAITIVILAFINVAILYFLLALVNALFRRRMKGKVER